MIYSEYEAISNRSINFGIDPGFTVTKFGGKCAINDYVALKLSAVSPKYSRDNVIPISLANGTSPLAYLVTCRSRDFGYGSASEFLAAAYLEDARPADIVDGVGMPRRDFVFRADYLVISVLEHADYMKRFRPGSGLWGGFVHVEELARRRTSYESSAQSIIANADIQINTDTEKDTIWRAIDHASPLERYLKLYHLVELIFDLVLVKKIKSLGQDLKGIGKLLNDYSGGNEFDRLHKIIKECSPNVLFFEKLLIAAFSDSKYHAQLNELLFDYSKDSNPYKEKGAAFWDVLAAGFSLSELKNQKLNNDHAHMAKLVAYIIYRVRCSIAHSKIGEYMLTQSDEEFVAEVAEPLLNEILIAIYS